MRWNARIFWVVAAIAGACGGQSVSRDGSGDGDRHGDAGESSGATAGTNGGGGTSRGGSGDGATSTSGGGAAGALGGTASGGTAGVVGAAGNVPAGGVAGAPTGGNATGGESGGVAGEAGSGSGGSACSTSTTPRMTFDMDAADWGVTYSASAISAVRPVDIASIMLGWTSTDGMPTAGALDLSVPFSSFGQYVGIGVSLFEPLDLSTSVVSACVKLVSGLGDAVDLSTNPGGVRIYARSGTGRCYANGAYHAIGYVVHPIGEWMLVSFSLLRAPDYVDPTCPEPFDPSDVRELGVQFDVSQSSQSARPALFRIDTLSY